VNCEEVKEVLSAFQDRELSAEEMTAVEAHLQDCANCAAQSSMITNLSRIVQHWEGVKASETARHQLIEKARTGTAGSARSVGPVALALLGILAALLLGGGIVALVLWYMDRAEPEPTETAPEVRRAAPAARSVEVTGRVELAQPDGAVLDVRGRRDLLPGQELRCGNGSAAQLELPGGAPRTVLMLRGSGALKFLPGELRLKSGTLVFHVPAAKAPAGGEEAAKAVLSVSAGRWQVEVPAEGAVGLVELAPDESLRLAVASGSARLTSAGAKSAMSVAAGKELSIDSGGTVSGPREVTDKRAFDLLRAGNEGK
jgi:anti-sigma factor RsiW